MAKTTRALTRGYVVILLPRLGGCLAVAAGVGVDAATMMPPRDLVPDQETAYVLRRECEEEVYATHGGFSWRWDVAEWMQECYKRKVQERPSLSEKRPAIETPPVTQGRR